MFLYLFCFIFILRLIKIDFVDVVIDIYRAFVFFVVLRYPITHKKIFFDNFSADYCPSLIYTAS